jgi:hypothetical protein
MANPSCFGVLVIYNTKPTPSWAESHPASVIPIAADAFWLGQDRA